MCKVALLAPICLALCVPLPAIGTMWYVDGSVSASGDGVSWETAFKKIQEGIDAADHGDTVMVKEGTYVENIKFNGKNITLTSTNPLDPTVVQSTIIDGNKAGPVVSFRGTEGESCVLSGFTVRNGIGAEGPYLGRIGGGIHGGGPFGAGTSATIENNVVTGNSTGRGGGIAFCDGIVRHNKVVGNSVTGESAAGGGIFYCNGIIEDNVISQNSSSSSGGGVDNCQGTIRNNTISANYGSGISGCDGTIEDNTMAENVGGGLAECNGTIRRNTIHANSREWGGGGLIGCDGTIENNTITENSGGGISGCMATIQNNLIAGNSAGEGGGGLYGCNGVIQNNLIVGNSSGRWGGVLYDCSGTIQNNTICGNKAAEVGGGLHLCWGSIRNCIIWDNRAAGVPNDMEESNTPRFCCVRGFGGVLGNITPKNGPQFVDPDGPDNDPSTYEDNDYHLADGSPCIGAGVNYYWFVWPQRDLDDNCRLAGERVDMGCYESGSSLDSDGDLLSDEDEAAVGTDPHYEDKDNDGLRDGLEILRGSDPTLPTLPGILGVPSDLPTIQASLCLAVEGEEIVAAPGTYRENIAFCGVDVILRSSNPDDPKVMASTVIDGGRDAKAKRPGCGPVVTFMATESEACVLSGFSIQNGTAPNGGGICGAADNWPTANHSHATIQNNVIRRNEAVSTAGPCCGGGGLAFCDGTIRKNLILANLAKGDGGGLAYCHGTIENSIIIGNSADGNGGGLGQCKAAVLNNTIVGNSAGLTCGGVSFHEQRGLIENCIIWGNSASSYPQLFPAPAPAYSCIQGWTQGGEGNIADDPRFVDPDGPDNDPKTYQDNDYRLADDSPCIDAGWNELWMSDAVDLDGNPRVIDGDGDGSYVVDIGAYEYKFALRVLEVTAAAGEFQLTWNSRPGHTYIVSVCSDLATWQWIGVATVPSQGFTTSWADSGLPADRRMFYRIDLE